MKGEIDKDFYCSTAGMADCPEKGNCTGCPDCRRKHPTPEQFKEEYGEEYPDDGAVYSLQQRMQKDSIFDKDPVPKWIAMSYEAYKNNLKGHQSGMLGVFILSVVCASTPFGKPDDTWRPE